MIFVRLGREKKTLLYGDLEIPKEKSNSKGGSNRSGLFTFFDEQAEIQTTDKITFSKFQTGMDCTSDNVDNYGPASDGPQKFMIGVSASQRARANLDIERFITIVNDEYHLINLELVAKDDKGLNHLLH